MAKHPKQEPQSSPPTSQSDKAQASGDVVNDPASKGREARIQELEAEVERLRSDLASEKQQAGVEKQVHDELLATMHAVAAAIEFSGPGKDLPNAVLERITSPRALADAPPESGWSSPRAKELVAMVAPDVRLLLLGDLLAELAPLAGETGVNESAQDVLKRVMEAAKGNALREAALIQECHETRKRAAAAEARESVLQAAMVARRSPSAEGEMRLALVIQALGPASAVHEGMTTHGLAARVVDEWLVLRELLGKQPMTAVAVRDDSTPNLAERYALGVLRWDGKRLVFDMIEGPSKPWADLVRPMRHAVDTQLVPPTFR